MISVKIRPMTIASEIKTPMPDQSTYCNTALLCCCDAYINMTITSFFSDQMIFNESSLQFDHELNEWSNTNETLQISFDHAKIINSFWQA